MCIIVYKPAGVKFPDFETLRNCEDSNPDGMGYMFHNNRKVYIHKGFFDLKDMLADMKETLPDLDEPAIVIHFRIATAGLVDAGNCHPFPVTKRVCHLRNPTTACHMGVAHNGIISEYSQKEKTRKLSDTMRFIKYASHCSPEQLAGLVTPTMGKFAVMTKEGVSLIGQFIEDDGIYYSNDNYLPCVWTNYYHTYQSNYMKKYKPVTLDELAEVLYEQYCVGCTFTDSDSCDKCWVWEDLVDLYKEHFRGGKSTLSAEDALKFMVEHSDKNFDDSYSDFLDSEREAIEREHSRGVDFAGYPVRDEYYDWDGC